MSIKIKIDGNFYEVEPGKNLLDACLSLGFNIPHFCYHPAMGSVGACRLCAVKKFANENDKKGQIVMSCMEPVKEGLVVHLHDEDIKAFRASIIENLMTNHPHDCPVCDEGGECHLQDMTQMTGHSYRRFDFPKRTFKNQNLGPFINHEMNRCIQCFRCVRFYKDYAGGKDFDVFAGNNQLYFGRQQEGTLESEFSGNLVEVCPTGVFTDKTLRSHFTRKWDLTNSPSICTHCSVGCNTIVSERYGMLKRIMNRYNGSVNGYFLCDRGRFGYEFVNDEKRLREVLICHTKQDVLETANSDTLNNVLKTALSPNSKIVGIGSPRASLEANFALSSVVGEGNFYQGFQQREAALVKKALNILQTGPARSPFLKEIEKADVILILGEDLTNTAPMMALSVRQASRTRPNEQSIKAGIPDWHDAALRIKAQGAKSPIFIATPQSTKLDELATNVYRASADDIARLGFAIASLLNPAAPSPKGLSAQQQELAKTIANELKSAVHPCIISGTSLLNEAIIEAAANVAWTLAPGVKRSYLSYVFSETNSLGLGMMNGKPLEELLQKDDEIDVLVVLENDLYRRADKKSIDRLLDRSRQVIVMDSLPTATTEKATVVLPSGTYAESDGTMVNNEGRAQRFYSVFPVQYPLQESWRWLNEFRKIKDAGTPWEKFDDLVNSMISAYPAFSKIKGHIPDADFRMLNEKVPRQTLRYSGRTAINANKTVHEPKPPQDKDSPLAFSMEGYKGTTPSSLVSYYWAPGWNSVQALYKYVDSPNGSMKDGDPGIRLIERNKNAVVTYFKNIPEAFKAKAGEWMMVPVYHIFGSDELSAFAVNLAKRISEPVLYINQAGAEKTGISEKATIKIDDKIISLKVKIENSLPDGIAGMSVQLSGMGYVTMPSWGTISKA